MDYLNHGEVNDCDTVLQKLLSSKKDNNTNENNNNNDDDYDNNKNDYIENKDSDSIMKDDEERLKEKENNEKDNKNDDDDVDDDDEDTKINSTTDADELLMRAMKYKEEGNALFQKGEYDKAGRSYRRGTNATRKLNENNNGDEQVKSLLLTLQTNLSMVCFKQAKYRQSRDVASQALDIDGTHVKALYRRGIANRKMGDIDAARVDFKAALKHDPDNRQVRKELVLIKQDLDRLKQKEKKALQAAFSSSSNKTSSFLYQDKEEEIRRKQLEKEAKKLREKQAQEKRKKQWEDECVQRLANNEEAISFDQWNKDRIQKEKEERDEIKRKKELERKKLKPQQQQFKRSNSNTNYQSSDSDSDFDEKEIAKLRGYKKTTDGKTTSYFTRELSHAEKAMIGDNAPKRLSSSSSDHCLSIHNNKTTSSTTTTTTTATTTKTTSSSSSSSITQSSKWNTAQTWEERDTTDWCITSLTNHLKSTECFISAIEKKNQFSSSSSSSTKNNNNYLVKVNKVESITGHSSFVLTSGRKRYIFDFSVTIQFHVVHNNELSSTSTSLEEEEEEEEGSSSNSSNNMVLVASGEYHLPDISSVVIDHEYDIDLLKWKYEEKEYEDEFKKNMCSTIKKDFCIALRKSVKDFVLDFNKHF